MATTGKPNDIASRGAKPNGSKKEAYAKILDSRNAFFKSKSEIFILISNLTFFDFDKFLIFSKNNLSTEFPH